MLSIFFERWQTFVKSQSACDQCKRKEIKVHQGNELGEAKKNIRNRIELNLNLPNENATWNLMNCTIFYLSPACHTNNTDDGERENIK